MTDDEIKSKLAEQGYSSFDIELTDGKFLIDGVDCNEWADATDDFIAAKGFDNHRAFAMLCIYAGSQAAIQDTTGAHPQFYHLNLISKLVANGYQIMMGKILEAAAEAKAKRGSSKIN